MNFFFGTFIFGREKRRKVKKNFVSFIFIQIFNCFSEKTSVLVYIFWLANRRLICNEISLLPNENWLLCFFFAKILLWIINLTNRKSLDYKCKSLDLFALIYCIFSSNISNIWLLFSWFDCSYYDVINMNELIINIRQTL